MNVLGPISLTGAIGVLCTIGLILTIGIVFLVPGEKSRAARGRRYRQRRREVGQP
jgi:hypothetical protein